MKLLDKLIEDTFGKDALEIIKNEENPLIENSSFKVTGTTVLKLYNELKSYSKNEERKINYNSDDNWFHNFEASPVKDGNVSNTPPVAKYTFTNTNFKEPQVLIENKGPDEGSLKAFSAEPTEKNRNILDDAELSYMKAKAQWLKSQRDLKSYKTILLKLYEDFELNEMKDKID